MQNAECKVKEFPRKLGNYFIRTLFEQREKSYLTSYLFPLTYYFKQRPDGSHRRGAVCAVPPELLTLSKYGK